MPLAQVYLRSSACEGLAVGQQKDGMGSFGQAQEGVPLA
jgi:hypothetical protein